MSHVNESIISCFRRQVENDGGKIAISWSNGNMDYSELDILSNQMANVLIDQFEIEESDFVAVMLPKSETLIAIIIAVLKCEASYVPIDPNCPLEKKEFILKDTFCKLIIDEKFLNQYITTFRHAKKATPITTTGNISIVNIMYTSKFKEKYIGVMVQDNNVLSLLKSCNKNFELSSKDSWLLYHSYSTDFSIWEIFGCLLNGGNLVLVNEEETQNSTSYVRSMNDHHVTIFGQTSSQFCDFVDSGIEVPSLRYVILRGKISCASKIREWSKKHPQVHLFKIYGNTETTVFTTLKKLTWDTAVRYSLNNIGKPLPLVRCYVVNKKLEVLPYGCAGELCVGGDGVTYGYLNNPQLDKKHFVDDLFFGQGKMYRTGDLVRFLFTGELEYLGKMKY
ncbi:AMP-binding protein [Spongiimicrobium salis]|uniref:AMP-binding protein n=1 Tax=Spongiimicrobium salis TaxID=1667022 RepID=UPI00374D3B90